MFVGPMETKMTKYFLMPGCDVYENLAAEEYIFQNFNRGTIFLLWKNEESIVFGRNQNIFQEIDFIRTEEQGVKIARRMTGGGTVYHDKGNINYSIIMDFDADTFTYDLLLAPVISALNKMGIRAHKQRTSDIAIDHKKISGSAQTIGHNRILHHGTLLYDANLSRMKEFLVGKENGFSSKATKSVPSETTNIRYFTTEKMNTDEFCQKLLSLILDENSRPITLNQDDWEKIHILREKKYGAWEWCYGHNPPFTYKNKWKDISVELEVKNGVIASCSIKGIKDCQLAEKGMLGLPFHYRSVFDSLHALPIEGWEKEKLVDMILKGE